MALTWTMCPLRARWITKKFKRRVYEVQLRMTNNTSAPGELRIVCTFPWVDWECVWKTLNPRGVHDTTKIKKVCRNTWHHSHQWRLTAVQLTDSGACSQCVHPDSPQHRIIECGEGPIIRNWTRQKLGIILRIDHKFIPQEWILRPDFLHWPPQSHAAISWPISSTVACRHTGVSHYAIIWAFLSVLFGRCISKPAHAPNVAGTWTYSITCISEATYWTWPPPNRLRGKTLYTLSSRERIDVLNNN